MEATVIVRRVMLCSVLISAVLASCCIAVFARTRVAPADEYFGRMKMSILEIGNRLHDLSYREEHNGMAAKNVLHDAEMTEDAIRDWERKYPADPWLARDVAGLVHVYAKLPVGAARSRAHLCLYWLERRYASRRALIAAERVEVALDDRLAGSSIGRR